VYKRQGRIQRSLMTCAYKVFLVHAIFHLAIPSTQRFHDSPCLSAQQPSILRSVARVQPGTSKGITDLLLTYFPRLTPVVGICKRDTTYHARNIPSGLARYRNQADKSFHEPKTAMHHHQRNLEKSPVCQSSASPDPVSFPVLSQIKPQAPHLEVSFRQSL
jgi:hypothetical protein